MATDDVGDGVGGAGVTMEEPSHHCSYSVYIERVHSPFHHDV